MFQRFGSQSPNESSKIWVAFETYICILGRFVQGTITSGLGRMSSNHVSTFRNGKRACYRMAIKNRAQVAKKIYLGIMNVRNMSKANTDSIALFLKSTEELFEQTLKVISNVNLKDPDTKSIQSAMIGAWRRIAQMQQAAVADQIESLVAVRNQLQKIQKEWSKKWKRTSRLPKNDGRVSQQVRKHKSRSSRK